MLCFGLSTIHVINTSYVNLIATFKMHRYLFSAYSFVFLNRLKSDSPERRGEETQFTYTFSQNHYLQV